MANRYNFGSEIPERRLANQTRFRKFAVPDTVTCIKKEAFMNSLHLHEIYIPKSVEIIERDAFKGCKNLEIYCEDEPKDGWVCEMRKEIISYEITTPEDDAFNFHRSGGSFTTTTVKREVKRFHDWNPDKLPVHTHVDKSVTADWDKIEKRLMIYTDGQSLNDFLMRKCLSEIRRESKELANVDIYWPDKDEFPQLEEKINPNCPALFFGEELLCQFPEGIRYSEIKNSCRNAMLRAIKEGE